MPDPANDERQQTPKGLLRLTLLFAGFCILICLVGGLIIGLLALLVDATG